MAKDFNQPFVVDGYDAHIRKLIPGYELVHLQISALLKTYLPEQAHILVVGCGTGYELRYLTQQFPQWQFTAIDPAENMLHKAAAIEAGFSAGAAKAIRHAKEAHGRHHQIGGFFGHVLACFTHEVSRLLGHGVASFT